jgi:hypothetical protein
MAWKYAPLRQQMRNIAAAERHIPALLPVLAKEARFAGVELKAYTALNGSLLANGEVASDADLTELKKIVTASQPPVEVIYKVRVISPEMRKLLENHPESPAAKE